MTVYMIRCGENGPVKIGHSSDPVFRLGQLQISHWETLHILRLFEGGLSEELALHERFADQYIRGEWHHFSRAMLGDVGLKETYILEPTLPPAPASITLERTSTATEIGANIRALRWSRGLTQQELADALAMARSSLASIEAGHDLPGRDALLRISKFFGVPFGDASIA